jgi:integrase
MLIRNGENPKYVSRQLGHSSTAFTMDVYGHCFQATSDEAMRRLEELVPRPNTLKVVGGREA